LGRDAFLAKYRFGKARNYFLDYAGTLYDSKAIVGAEHGYQYGTPLPGAEGALFADIPSRATSHPWLLVTEDARRPALPPLAGRSSGPSEHSPTVGTTEFR
jgi:hypothetical protein